MALNTKMALCSMGAAAVLAGADCAYASAELQIDINQSTYDGTAATNGVAFDGGDTGAVGVDGGTITFSGGSLQDISFVGGASGLTGGATLDSFLGSITIADGIVTGGSFLIELSTGDNYAATFTGGTATFLGPAGSDPLAIVALTFDGIFTTDGLGGGFDGVFGGADLTGFAFPNGSLSGSFRELTLDGFGSGGPLLDSDVSTEVFVIVPTPGAALAAIPMLGIVGLRRRRRQG